MLNKDSFLVLISGEQNKCAVVAGPLPPSCCGSSSCLWIWAEGVVTSSLHAAIFFLGSKTAAETLGFSFPPAEAVTSSSMACDSQRERAGVSLISKKQNKNHLRFGIDLVSVALPCRALIASPKMFRCIPLCKNKITKKKIKKSACFLEFACDSLQRSVDLLHPSASSCVSVHLTHSPWKFVNCLCIVVRLFFSCFCPCSHQRQVQWLDWVPHPGSDRIPDGAGQPAWGGEPAALVLPQPTSLLPPLLRFFLAGLKKSESLTQNQVKQHKETLRDRRGGRGF